MPNRVNAARPENALGTYLKDRRTKLDPAAFGFPPERRRTPGLRREEVAQRANISATWYTWLEQGRGGAPSADVLDRIARALMLTELEREHLFLLGLGRPPEARYLKQDGVTPRLQRVLDALDPAPAVIRTATFDVVAWNQAATVMLGTTDRFRRSSATCCASSFSIRALARRNMTGKAWRGMCWARWRPREPGPPKRLVRSLTSFAGSVLSSGRCGATTR
jgi:transcriptional regulator with XRE-family HTH domain